MQKHEEQSGSGVESISSGSAASTSTLPPGVLLALGRYGDSLRNFVSEAHVVAAYQSVCDSIRLHISRSGEAPNQLSQDELDCAMDWIDCEHIASTEAVHQELGIFSADSTFDNAVALVRTIRVAHLEQSGQRWISVQRRLPQPGQEVLVYRPDAPESGDPVVRTAFYGKHGRTGIHGFNCYVQPTHWMPLPDAPTPSAQGEGERPCHWCHSTDASVALYPSDSELQQWICSECESLVEQRAQGYTTGNGSHE